MDISVINLGALVFKQVLNSVTAGGFFFVKAEPDAGFPVLDVGLFRATSCPQ